MYQLREKAGKLGNLIELSKEKHFDQRPEKEAIQADNDWAAAHLLAKLFFESEILPYTYILPADLTLVRLDFEAKEGAIDFDSLINKFWIRTIGGIVEVPSSISSAAKQYEKIKGAEAEYFFLVEAVDKLKSHDTIAKQSFLNFLNEYQNNKEQVISLEKCKSLHWLEEKDEKIKIHNLEYNKPIFQFKKEFQFINSLLKKAEEGNKYKLKLQYELLEDIHLKHKNFYPGTPVIEELISQKVIIKEGSTCYLNLWACQPDYWLTLNAKIGFFLYSQMKESGKYSLNSNLFKNWILKLRFIDAFIDSPKFMNAEETETLLNCCVDMLVNENDLIGTDIEIDKLVLSKRHSDYIILSNARRIGFPDLTKATDIFELFNLMEDCNEVHQSDLLWMQGSRWLIAKLIQIIIFHDDRRDEDGLANPYIRKLLTEGITRPYLLWKTCFYIHYWRPEIIPFLCLDEKVAALAFNLSFISKTDTRLSESQAGDVQNEILLKCFNLLLSGLISNRNINKRDKAIQVFECLITVAENRWQQYRNDPTKQVLEKRVQYQKIFEGLLEVLKNKRLQGSYYSPDGEIQKYFFPEILPQLFNQIQEYNSQKIYTEGVVGLPLIKLELLSSLLALISTDKYKKQRLEIEVLEEKVLVTQFLKEYTDIFNLSTVSRWSYMEGKREDTTPLWSTHQKGIELIPWEQWTMLLENYELLPQFLVPDNLKLKYTSDKWDKHNQFTIDKIRKHLEILIIIHQRLREKEFTYKQEGFKIATVISRLEQSIADYISKYSVEDSINGRIDILEDRHERTVFGSQENALLPIIAQAINKFEQNKKIEILKSLTQADSFTKCLKLLEFLSSDADINFIKEQIKGFDVSGYLDEKSYIPEIETVVVKLSEFEEFIDKAKEALDYWEKRILTQRNNTEYLITHFRIKLLIAYYEGDEQTILNEKAPPVDSFSTSNGFEFKPVETRDFYLGLVKLKNNDPENAYKIFSRLINSSKNDESSIAINRLYSHISLAELKVNKDEKEKALSDALTEWEAYENTIPNKDRMVVLEYVQENIWINKLNIFNKLQRYTEFDKLFSSLDKSYQLRKDFFEVRVTNYVQRRQYEMAKSVVAEAKNYHQSKEGLLPEFIKISIEKLEDEEDYRRLRQEYLDLVSRTPEKLIQILPENMVGKRNIPNYVLKEICGSANDVLDNINAVEKIDIEDKYSDLLILSLQSRLRNWHWKVGNARGGFSASNKRNPGELDFVITSADNERIATCEALLLHGKNTSTVTTHAIKTFNYDHRRKLFFIVAYYNGTNAAEHWTDYKTTIIPNINFPDGFPVSVNVEEINEFYTNDSVKALLATHADNTLVYHVFINLKYKL